MDEMAHQRLVCSAFDVRVRRGPIILPWSDWPSLL
jgi:hypothetical protein